jgi:hypothetical protein
MDTGGGANGLKRSRATLSNAISGLIEAKEKYHKAEQHAREVCSTSYIKKMRADILTVEISNKYLSKLTKFFAHKMTSNVRIALTQDIENMRWGLSDATSDTCEAELFSLEFAHRNNIVTISGRLYSIVPEDHGLTLPLPYDKFTLDIHVIIGEENYMFEDNDMFVQLLNFIKVSTANAKKKKTSNGDSAASPLPQEELEDDVAVAAADDEFTVEELNYIRNVFISTLMTVLCNMAKFFDMKLHPQDQYVDTSILRFYLCQKFYY